MKISTQDIGSSQVALEIEVDSARMERAYDQAYRRAAGRINVPGFRKGKAPRALVEQMIGRPSLLEDAIEHLVPEVYRDAINESGLHPIEQATFEVVETEPLRIKATVPVRPEIQLGDYRNLRHELVVPEITTEQVDAVVEQLRESNATWTPVERPLALEDRIAMDVHGTVGEKVILDRRDVEYDLRADNPRPLPGFADAIIGMNAGEAREFTLAVPADFGDEALRGQDASFRVQVHWVKEKSLPELDDSFASQVGAFTTLAEVREHIEQELQSRAEAEARRELQESVVDAVVGVAQFELPPQAIAKQAERLRERMSASLEQQGISVEQYLSLTGKTAEALDEELRGQARRDLSRAFVLDHISEAEGITVSREEVDAEIRQAAGANAKAALARQDTRERVEMALSEHKTIQRLVQLATGEGEPTEALTAATAGAEERSNV